MPKLKIPLSAEALAQKKADLARVLTLKKEVMGRLVVAREMGDLSENGAYKAAKFELGGINRQIRELNYILHHAYVPEIDVTDVAGFGKTITLKNADQTLVFTLVGSYEADPEQLKFSFDSPLGQAVNGKQVGDQVTVVSPKGKTEYSLVEIK